MITDEKLEYLETVFQGAAKWDARYDKLRAMLDDIKDLMDDAHDIMVNLSGELMDATDTVFDADASKLLRDPDHLITGDES